MADVGTCLPLFVGSEDIDHASHFLAVALVPETKSSLLCMLLVESLRALPSIALQPAAELQRIGEVIYRTFGYTEEGVSCLPVSDSSLRMVALRPLKGASRAKESSATVAKQVHGPELFI